MKKIESISDDMTNKEMKLSGKVVNCKAGPCIQLKDGNIIYVQGLRDVYIGKNISIMGILKIKKIIPDPKVNQDGAISAGAHGKQYVLEDIKNIKVQ
ncbi:MAG: hypothetical protein GF329_12050 [Candidatus Lokiarchaeota archaeon]|nr:hypothetical protein [Candidatus Lokiarchaeota archaeon]